jgi:hypothetical protein
MSSYLIKQFIKGIALRGETSDITENVEGSLFHNSTQQKIKSYIEGAVREVITESQIQTLTNKTISAADNLIVVASTNPNLTSIELNNALTELQTDIDSNSGNLSSHIAAADPHPQYETSVEAQSKVDAHANRVDNPHSVTKTQVGLGNVDNTSDINKPVSTATQTALDLKIDESREGQPSGIATLDGTGKVPASQLPSYVDDVVEVSDFAALPVTGESSKIYVTLDNNKTYRWSGSVYIEISPSEVNSVAGKTGVVTLNKTDVGLSNVDNTSDLNKPVSTATQNALDAKANVSHTHTSTDITDFNESVDDRVNTLIIAGSNVSKSYDDLANTLTLSASVITDHTALSNIGTNSHADIDSHISSTSNPHSVTKAQVGLSNVDNTSDANKPISTATQTALDLKIDESREGQPLGIATLDGAGKVPAAQLPSYVDDVVEVSDFAALPTVGEAGKAYVTLDNNKVYRWSGSVYIEISPSIGTTWGSITGTLAVQTDLQSALDGKANSTHTHLSTDITDFNESVDDRVSSLIVAGSNISANYDDLANTLTISSTVSVITDHTALSNIGTNSHASIDLHIASTSNPHSVTKSQVGLSDVPNVDATSRANHTGTQTASTISDFNSAADARVSSGISAHEAAADPHSQYETAVEVQAKVDAHANLTNNPHAVTKSQVGLGNVDNTSDANKPISNATQSALDGKANTSHSHVASDITDLSEAIDDRISSTIVAGTNVTVSYDDLANTLTISAAGGGSGGATTLDGLTDVSVPSPSNGQALIYNTSTSQWEAQTISSGSGATDLNGLNDVTLSGTLDNQILRYDLASTQWKNETLLKDDIGLSNVDNTSDANKPISLATQSALDGKASSVHTHVSTDVTDFSEAVDDRVSSLLVAGSNITLSYDDLANTLSISSAGAPASTSAERLITNVFNDSGATIAKMSAIYISGSQGDQARIVLAQANTESTSSKTYGLVQSDILATESGVVVEQGRLGNLNTDIAEWTEGDVLWLSSTVAGGITNVKPSAPNHAVFIGYLIKKHQSVGVIQVSIQNGYELQELHNVAIASVADGQVIKYESSTSLWKNQTLTKSDVGLSNVDNTSDANKPISTATQAALDSITDVNWTGDYNNGTTYTVGDGVMFNGASFRMVAAIGAAGYNPVAYPANWLQVTEYVSPNDIGLGNVDNTSDLDKPISSATQLALNGKANTSHTHVAADITDFNAAVDARIPTIPAAVSSVNGDSGPDVVLDSDDIQEGTTNLYLTNERVDDRVNDLLVAGSGISLSYNDVANTLTIASLVNPVPVLSKGGLLTSDGTQNGELTVGTTGQILSADSSEPSGLKWIAAGSGSAKYVRGFTFSGNLEASTTGVPLVITSAATITKLKGYGVGVSGNWSFALFKNGSPTPFTSIVVSSSSVFSQTISESVAEDDIITCVIGSTGSSGSDFSITMELS